MSAFQQPPPPHENDFNETQVKEILKASYLNPSGAKKRLEDLGYTYVPKFSNNEAKVFLDNQGSPNVVFRGTKLSRVKDWISDINIALGREKQDPRFQDSENLVRNLENFYGKPVNTFGDSLGAKLSRTSGASGNIYMHNPAFNLSDIGTTIKKREHVYRNKGDPVSFLSSTLYDPYKHIKQKKVKKNIIGQHKIIM